MTATAMKPKLGDQRYLACFCSAETLKADARNNGWSDDADHGPLDYVDTGDHELSREAPNFEAAVKIARTLVADDFFGCPRVYLQEFGPADVPAQAREWENVKFWDVPAEGDPEEQSV